MTQKEKAQDVESFLLHSEYFWRFTLREWARKHPDRMKEIIQEIRQDEAAEADVQYHIKKVADG